LLGVHRLLKYKRKLAKRSRDADETLFVPRWPWSGNKPNDNLDYQNDP
jgi:hypothetical protein